MKQQYVGLTSSLNTVLILSLVRSLLLGLFITFKNRLNILGIKNTLVHSI